MRRTLLALAMLLLAAQTMPTAGRTKKKTATKVQQNIETCEEIDNYDFLYADGYDGLNYNAAAVNSIMDEAMSHLGARYRSGSKGPSAFDCSGFTSYVFGRQNMQIGCSSRDQYAHNIPIERSEMQRGDLVFFTSPGSGHGVGHVGIVVDVDPLTHSFSFIHASSSGGVKISNSSEGFYSSRYIGARRVLE